MVQPLWKTVSWFLKKLKVEWPRDPAIPLLGIYPPPKENTHSKRCIHSMVTAAQFTIAKTWKQLKCLSTEEWIKKMCIYTMEYYSAIKRMK